MRLTGVKVDDLLKVDDGLEFYARVLDLPARQRVTVQPITFRSSPRVVRARDVLAHYRKARVRVPTKEEC